ncbi:secA translation cis-regulator SecM [Serratia rhizosphaerae]|uniref:secA translation cis-regulator SecM n=1 Tax=unclassified Serratia (in: enterobacteria) TaxID=2647522 RepID=UPI000CF744E6|nr:MULTISPECIES: secA translation cis-regulator SecM [unclassified Serratia (in: enterobacteria)]MBU3893583.1 secA translation cis-regulator SecM [Serratia rubidaea]AVJ16266.1 secA regulator SecM [Serratia sp. MYb239]MCA4825501.1 secA translation cis-regulator SecM [Serratia rubidaea]QNK31788.1 secA regulator SecM [Serratia sp. JUb9]QPT14283.1 secA regulator SecM [Serratia rubidaea]
MIGILNRWRQFGRRYFWPHLLLGMVAATLGVPQNLTGGPDQAALPSTSSSLNRQNSISHAFSGLALLQEVHRRPNFSVDYWQQHALRTVIRHLSFALAPQVVYARVQESDAEPVEPPLKAAQLALLFTLNTLLTHEPKPPTIIRDTHHSVHPPLAQHQVGLWLAQVQGIRAGPAAAV